MLARPPHLILADLAQMFGRQPPVQRLRPAGGGFSCEIPSMRKHTINTSEPNPPRTSEEWLNLEEIAQVEVSSEDPKYPIESAFMRGECLGWRASQPGKQTIRLLFDDPKDLRRIWLRFTELQVERKHQFTLRGRKFSEFHNAANSCIHTVSSWYSRSCFR